MTKRKPDKWLKLAWCAITGRRWPGEREAVISNDVLRVDVVLRRVDRAAYRRGCEAERWVKI
jgi:hypothetical protein